ncbi:N-acetylmuramoyl-L-alanine amidase family protein [Cohnella luojiensis]|uniref:AMIN domain-containing protein n=1 Tax=Cohnella luojiensis TaxID=652876 RepID=A0A4Y8M5L9_9BACL|nr:N-acetylmuramoyl-L-alanine amidase family protein [Cohnella luojiensis]TFE30062.1 AMIN domain-containing protein [Cohnella luojiensis]
MKKWLSLLFVVASMLFLSAGIVNAAKSEAMIPKLILDGKALQPKVPPIVMDKSVMIPVRIATESLGYKVDYDNNKKQVTVSNSKKKLVMTLDKPTAYLDSMPQQMVLPPTLKSNNILIPLRFLGDSLGVQVFWDNQSKSAFLFSSDDNEDGNNDGSDTTPPDGGLIGIVDPEEGEGNGDGSEVPPVTPNPPVDVTGTLYEVRYETDSVVLKYDGLIAPSHFKLDNPQRIVIDIPNTKYADTFLPLVDFTTMKEGSLLVTEHEALKSVRYSMFGDAVKSPRFVLDLNQAWDYEVLNDPTIGELRFILKKPLPDKSLFTVVLDAGHGGSDPGAISISKKAEKTFNLSVILKVQAILAIDERLKLVLTRSGDSFPSLSDRYNLANSIQADLFVSVHANSFTSSTNGTETYYTRADSKAFADLMHSLLVQATGLKDNGVRQRSFAVTRETKMPAVLIEAGYLSSKIDEPQMWTDDFQNRVAQAIATGIMQQLKLT